MGKVKKQGHRFQYDRNRKKAWKKSRRDAAIECEQIKHAWDSKKSVTANMRTMGLSSDANTTLRIPKATELLSKSKKMESMSLSELKETPSKIHVMEDLEHESLIPRERGVRLSQAEVDYCTYMLNRYGDDVKKMARDKRNYYQETPKQIRQKINLFKSIPEQYNEYLKSKNSPKT